VTVLVRLTAGGAAGEGYAAAVIETVEGGSDEHLRRIEAVTDASLSKLDVEALFDELLDRTRELLGVDTAVVLLHDAHSRRLVATAAKGLEQEVRQGVGVYVGYGFAERVAREVAPVIVEDVTPGRPGHSNPATERDPVPAGCAAAGCR
jgi:GAF domain-containing protein